MGSVTARASGRHWHGVRDRRGQAAVEVALVLPVFALLLVGVVEFARAWHAYQLLTDAAREGARTAVLANPLVTGDSVRAVVRNALQRGSLNLEGTEVVIEGLEDPSGTPLTVRLRYLHQIAVLGGTGGGTLELATTVVMRNE